MDILVHGDGLPGGLLLLVGLDVGQVLGVVMERGIGGVAEVTLAIVAAGLETVAGRPLLPTGHVSRRNLHLHVADHVLEGRLTAERPVQVGCSVI